MAQGKTPGQSHEFLFWGYYPRPCKFFIWFVSLGQRNTGRLESSLGFSLALPKRRTSAAVRLLLFARADGISQFWSQQGAGLFAAGRVLRYSPKAKSSATPLRAKELFRLHARTIKDSTQNAALPVFLYSIALAPLRPRAAKLVRSRIYERLRT